MSAEHFDRDDLKACADYVKQDIFASILGAHDSKILPEHFADLVGSAMSLYGTVVRSQLLEVVAAMLQKNELTEDRVVKSINFLVKQCDIAAEGLAKKVLLIEETQKPGSRH